MKFATIFLGLLATSTHALLNEGADLPRGIAGDLNAKEPAHEPCTGCVHTWHPPHKVEVDDCGDFGNGEWHWIRPASKAHKQADICSTTVVTIARVETVVDCLDHKSAVATGTASTDTTILPNPNAGSNPTATGNQAPGASVVVSGPYSQISGYTPVVSHTPSSHRLGWKGSYDASPTVSTLVVTPCPTPIHPPANISAIRPFHTPAVTIPSAPQGFNPTTAMHTQPTVSETRLETSGATSSMYNMGILVLVGFVAVLAL